MKKLLLIFIILILSLTFLYFYHQYFKTPKLVFFNVGQGDATFFRTKSGENILIDGGPDKNVLEKIGRYLPFYDREIDLIVLTHPHADHVTGLVEVLKRYGLKKIMLTAVVHTAPSYLEFLKTLKDKNIQIIKPTDMREINFDGLKFEILYPFNDLAGMEISDLNDSSIVILAQFENKKIMLTGDISIKIEKQILEKYKPEKLKAQIIKIAHQGSDTSSSEEFLKTVAPEIAVISVGENNFGHPNPRVIKRLERLNIEVLKTDEKGDLVF